MLALAFKQENPKRKGTKSFHRYEAYKSAKNVSEYAEKNKDPSYTNADLRNDIGVGLVSCEGGWDAAKQALAVVLEQRRDLDEAPGPVAQAQAQVQEVPALAQDAAAVVTPGTASLSFDYSDILVMGHPDVTSQAKGGHIVSKVKIDARRRCSSRPSPRPFQNNSARRWRRASPVITSRREVRVRSRASGGGACMTRLPMSVANISAVS
jgi:hypothetical protein